jgi:hypothetical protein
MRFGFEQTFAQEMREYNVDEIDGRNVYNIVPCCERNASPLTITALEVDLFSSQKKCFLSHVTI